MILMALCSFDKLRMITRLVRIPKQTCLPARQVLLIMKLTAFIILSACLTASGNGFGQTISLSERNASLSEVFKKIERQTDYTFAYTGSQLSQAKRVTVEINNGSLEQVLALCFKDQPFTYTIIERTIVVKPKTEGPGEQATSEPPLLIDIKGSVVNEKGEPVEGVTVTVKGTKNATATDINGMFQLKGVDENAILVFSGVNVESYEIKINGKTDFAVNLKTKVSELDMVIVQAYGTTTKRLNTGNIGKVTSEEISKQPVANPLAALQGRVPGLVVTQTSGVPGSSFKVQVRGRTSLDLTISNDDPLFIIDGVPFAPNNFFANRLTSGLISPANVVAGISPLNSINPSDIESIEILKDADATAIYGSRGANGVILITTKKGEPGKTRVDINFYSGISKVTKTMPIMNTAQYVQMRKEAFQNDGVTPTNNNAYDLLVWDTTRFTDFKDLLIGGTANITDAQVSVSGGNANTQFLIGAGYHHETTVFPGDLKSKRGSLHFRMSNTSLNRKFNVNLSGNYSVSQNNLTAGNLTNLVYNLLPNTPSLYDSAGKLNFQQGGFNFTNPFATLLQEYDYRSDNLLSNLQIGYKILPGLSIKTNLGYSFHLTDEIQVFPIASINPVFNPTGSSLFGNNNFKSWIIEPQIEYIKQFGNGKLSVLGGATWQQGTTKRSSTSASGYISDAQLKVRQAAGSLTASDDYSVYKYEAGFGRINYNWKDKYILNLTGRRDGSSRFGPGRQFANFGAGGVAWIFSNEPFMQKLLPFISFGKLRASYGTTGNDKIGDYIYLNTWTNTPRPYQTTPGLVPFRLFNPDYNWEINKKLEAAIDLGLIQDKVLISIVYFRNRSSNQLVNYKLPDQTGFGSVLQNLPALVQNKGWEFTISTKNINTINLKWITEANFSIPRNKLISFPGLKNSSYATTYVEGESLSLIYKYHFVGVDPATGIYVFEDANQDGVLNSKDFVALGNTDIKFLGGLNNSIIGKLFRVDIFFEFKQQTGENYLSALRNNRPGTQSNLPVIYLGRWQKPGDLTNFQKFTTTTSSAAFQAAGNILNSNAYYGDASFIRLKNLSVSFDVPQSWLKKIRATTARLYLHGQNLITISNFDGYDPETQNIGALPPLRTFVMGLQFQF